MEMKSMVAGPPSHSALLACCACLIGLTFYAKVHDMVSADCTIIHHNVPSPKCYRIPLLYLKSFLFLEKCCLNSQNLPIYSHLYSNEQKACYRLKGSFLIHIEYYLIYLTNRGRTGTITFFLALKWRSLILTFCFEI